MHNTNKVCTIYMYVYVRWSDAFVASYLPRRAFNLSKSPSDAAARSCCSELFKEGFAFESWAHDAVITIVIVASFLFRRFFNSWHSPWPLDTMSLASIASAGGFAPAAELEGSFPLLMNAVTATIGVALSLPSRSFNFWQSAWLEDNINNLASMDTDVEPFHCGRASSVGFISLRLGCLQPSNR
jgi:hypothetical protein